MEARACPGLGRFLRCCGVLRAFLFFLAPGYWWLMHARMFPSMPLSDFLRALFLALLLLSLAACWLWLAWVLNGNHWDVPNKRRYMMQMQCCADLDLLPQMLLNAGYASAA